MTHFHLLGSTGNVGLPLIKRLIQVLISSMVPRYRIRFTSEGPNELGSEAKACLLCVKAPSVSRVSIPTIREWWKVSRTRNSAYARVLKWPGASESTDRLTCARPEVLTMLPSASCKASCPASILKPSADANDDEIKLTSEPESGNAQTELPLISHDIRLRGLPTERTDKAWKGDRGTLTSRLRYSVIVLVSSRKSIPMITGDMTSNST
jgi:hypothetical protein